MSRWNSRIEIKHLFTGGADAESVRASMAAVADALDASPAFVTFRVKSKFREIPDGDDIITPLDYANVLMEHLYDYADEHRIWIA